MSQVSDERPPRLCFSVSFLPVAVKKGDIYMLPRFSASLTRLGARGSTNRVFTSSVVMRKQGPISAAGQQGIFF